VPYSSIRVLPLTVVLCCLAAISCEPKPPSGGRGLIHRSTETAEGYVLLAPLLSTATYLVDTKGLVVHVWDGPPPASLSNYLLDDGRLLRSVKRSDPGPFTGTGGYGGRIQELSWDGPMLWDYVLPEGLQQHHDFEPLTNGNVLMIAWEKKTREEALAAGRLLNRVGWRGLWSDCVVEVRPIRPDGGEILWRWCMWDHLIQDLDAGRPGFGIVSEHPELIDINGDRYPRRVTKELLRRLKAIGYVAEDATPTSLEPDFTHTNSIDYHPGLDQIVLSVPRFDEIWIIDHSTSTHEAAGHNGGRYGRGGDLLYRWGNPVAYGRGGLGAKKLYSQHDARWIPAGLPGAGNLTIFNNGLRRSRHAYSSVLEIELPLAADGSYRLDDGAAYGPTGPTWRYTANPKTGLFAEYISGAERLPNGNTLITDGPRGRLLQVTPAGKTVWIYDNPFSGDAPNPYDEPPYSLFRASFVSPDHPALEGRDLEPLDPQPAGKVTLAREVSPVNDVGQ